VDRLLHGVLSLVFTDAVLEAAVGTGPQWHCERSSIHQQRAGQAMRYDQWRRCMAYATSCPDQPGPSRGSCVVTRPTGGPEGSCCSLPSDVRGRKAGDSVSVRYNLLSMSAGGGLSIEPESVIDVAACALAAVSLAAASASWN
jgi:hypothetical protein